MKQVTVSQIVDVVKSVKSSTMLSFTAETPADMNKTGNPYFGTIKKNIVAGQVGFFYDNAVNNQLGREEKEMDFEAQKPVWAVGLPDTRNLVTNKAGSKYYLYVKIQSAGTPQFFFNGQEIPVETIKPYLKPHTKPHSQDDLSKEVCVRMYGLENIRQINMLGEEYVIVEPGIESGKKNVAEEKVTENV